MSEDHFTNARILIVDDQEANNILLETILEQDGFQHFKSLTDPRQVLDVYTEFQPDLILLDLMMPYLDGFAVMEGLRPLIPAGSYLPILVLTADVTPEAKRRALASGAKDFLTKPLDTTEVMLRIKNLLETRFLHLQLQNQNQILEENVAERTAQLAKSEAKYRILIEQIPAITYINDLHSGPGQVQFVSQQVEDFLGITPEEWVKGGFELWHQTIHPEDWERVLAEYQRHTQTGQSFDCEYRCLARDGRVVWVHDTARLLRDEAGQPHLIHGIMFDITERVQAEATLREQAERFRTMLSTITEGFWLVDDQGRLLDVNQAYCRMSAYSKEELLTLSIPDLEATETPEETAGHIQTIIEAGSERFESQHKTKDGRIFDVEIIVAFWPEKRQFFVFIQDISERKQAEAEIKKLSSAIEQTADLVFITDRKGVIEYVNPALEALSGYSKEEIVGQSPRLLKSGKHTSTEYQELWETILKGEVWRSMIINRKKDGELYYEEETISPLRDSRGEITHFVSTSKDITEQMRVQESLRKSEASLEEAQRIAHLGSWEWDPETDTPIWSKELYAILEVDPSKPAPSVAEQDKLYTPESMKRMRSGIEQALGGTPYEIELERVREDGTRKWLLARGEPMFDQDGRIVRLRGTALDITERKQALLALQQRAHELATLYESAMTISSNLSLEVVLKTVAEQVSRAINADGCAVSFWDQERDTLITMVDHRTASTELADMPGTTYALKDYPATRRVLETRQPLLTSHSDPQADPAELALMEKLDMGTVLLLPLVARDQVIGLMEVYEVENKERLFTEEEIRLAQSLSVQTAIFIDNARLFEHAERRLRRTEALHQVDNAIAGSMDVDLVFHVIFDQAFAQLGADAAVVLLFNPVTQVLEYAAGRGFRTETLQHTRLRLGEGYAGQAALGRQTVHVPELRTRTMDFLRSPSFSQEGFISYFGVPLIAKGEIKGVLEIFHRTAFAAEAEWLDFLETLAGQAAIAIDSATLYRDLQRSNLELSLAYDATIEGWSRALDLRDEETEGHTQRVTAITIRMAQAMGMSADQLLHIRRGALLHDIGKMGIPDRILLKPDQLTDEEWTLMRKHPVFAYEMLKPIAYLKPALDIPYCHHEKWDGTGYPRGLKGEEIPLAARIFAVIDVYDALTSDRPYRKAWSQEKTLQHIQELVGTHFDPNVIETFLKLKDHFIEP